MTLYDEVIQIPLLLKGPKVNETPWPLAGTANADFAREIDLAPTLLHFAGVEPDPAMSGKSLLAEDETLANADIAYTYSEIDLDNNVMQSTRTHEAKVILANPDNPRGLAPVECYDLSQDPLEQHNLAENGVPCNPDLEKLTRKMMEFSRGNAAEPGVQKTLSDEQEEQLRGLGYLGAE